MSRRERWKKKEIELFNKGYSNRQIADMTGRSMRAVETKRHFVNVGDVGYDEAEDETVTYNPFAGLTKRQKEERIIMLAQRLGVKIGG